MQERLQDVAPCLGERQSMREIVDVLRRAREVNELRDARHFRDAREPLLQPILDRLDVVLRLALDGLDAGSIVLREALADFSDGRSRCVGKGRDLGDGRFGGQCTEPCKLDADAMANQSEFAELPAQRGDFARVSAVERR